MNIRRKPKTLSADFMPEESLPSSIPTDDELEHVERRLSAAEHSLTQMEVELEDMSAMWRALR